MAYEKDTWSSSVFVRHFGMSIARDQKLQVLFGLNRKTKYSGPDKPLSRVTFKWGRRGSGWFQ
jgi:hypothetical protein